jgi:hypothetical protein
MADKHTLHEIALPAARNDRNCFEISSFPLMERLEVAQ